VFLFRKDETLLHDFGRVCATERRGAIIGEGIEDIYVINVDGRLTDNPGADKNPVWQPPSR
jgi:hypothetical protein